MDGTGTERVEGCEGRVMDGTGTERVEGCEGRVMDRTGLGQKELRVVKVELCTGQGRDWKVKYVF